LGEGNESVLSEADQLSIRRLHDAWLEAELRGDAEAVLDLCTQDVEWVPPSGPPTFGREAGRDLLLASVVRLLSIQIMDFVLDGADGRAIKVCRYETAFELMKTRVRGVTRGTHTWKLEQQVHGWRVASVSWQPDAEGDNVRPSTSSSIG
jgi:uncharacterized protein (TIGR02246 family)